MLSIVKKTLAMLLIADSTMGVKIETAGMSGDFDGGSLAQTAGMSGYFDDGSLAQTAGMSGDFGGGSLAQTAAERADSLAQVDASREAMLVP